MSAQPLGLPGFGVCNAWAKKYNRLRNAVALVGMGDCSRCCLQAIRGWESAMFEMV